MFTEPVILALILFAGGVVGWFAKITIAEIKSKPQPKPDSWNGNERRTKDIIDSKINIHRLECPAKNDFFLALDKLRAEMKADIEKVEGEFSKDIDRFKQELRESLHNLHEEIQRSRS